MEKCNVGVHESSMSQGNRVGLKVQTYFGTSLVYPVHPVSSCPTQIVSPESRHPELPRLLKNHFEFAKTNTFVVQANMT